MTSPRPNPAGNPVGTPHPRRPRYEVRWVLTDVEDLRGLAGRMEAIHARLGRQKELFDALDRRAASRARGRTRAALPLWPDQLTATARGVASTLREIVRRDLPALAAPERGVPQRERERLEAAVAAARRGVASLCTTLAGGELLRERDRNEFGKLAREFGDAPSAATPPGQSGPATAGGDALSGTPGLRRRAREESL